MLVCPHTPYSHYARKRSVHVLSVFNNRIGWFEYVLHAKISHCMSLKARFFETDKELKVAAILHYEHRVRHNELWSWNNDQDKALKPSSFKERKKFWLIFF